MQTLSTIVITFLVGIAAGSAAGARWADRLRDRIYAFGVVELLLGIFGVVSVAAVAGLPKLIAAFPRPEWEDHIAMLFTAAAMVMFVPTFLMGFLFPLVARIRVRRIGAVGTEVGDIYAFNTAGAIFGAFAAGFVLIPGLGTQFSLEFLALINLAAGLLLVLWSAAGLRRKLAPLVLAGGFFLLWKGVMPGEPD